MSITAGTWSENLKEYKKVNTPSHNHLATFKTKDHGVNKEYKKIGRWRSVVNSQTSSEHGVFCCKIPCLCYDNHVMTWVPFYGHFILLSWQEGMAPINLVIETEMHRATPGGTGGVKTIGNYAAVS